LRPALRRFATEDVAPAVAPWIVARVVVVAALGLSRYLFNEIGSGRRPVQLGPSVSRVVPESSQLRQLTFPATSTPLRVNWVDYADKVDAADPAAFAQALLDRAGTKTVWLVSSSGYQPFGTKCETISAGLAAARGPGRSLVSSDPNIFEHMGVLRFDP